MKKLLIIPAFNEAKNLPKLITEIKEKAPDYDYVIINDGSTDDTKKICKEHDLNVLNLPLNLGIGGAMQTGYLYALENNYDIAVQIDGDGQHDPLYIDKVVEPILKGEADLSIGSRFIEKEGFQSSFLRRLGISLLGFIIMILTGKRFYDVTSGLRACNRKVINCFVNSYPEDYPEPESLMMLAMLDFKILEIPVIMRERAFGVSSIYFIAAVYYMIKVILSLFLIRIRNKKKMFAPIK